MTLLRIRRFQCTLEMKLVPRGTHVLVQFIDHPDRFHYNVWVFNAQAGVTINYNNGSFQQKGD
ncbi:hypothetical protein LCA32G_1284 [Lacticaseibacillus paracasei]|nr:hypothetical protein LCA32G_1284 [Lacticaseibacillus paracasei]